MLKIRTSTVPWKCFLKVSQNCLVVYDWKLIPELQILVLVAVKKLQLIFTVQYTGVSYVGLVILDLSFVVCLVVLSAKLNYAPPKQKDNHSQHVS